MATQPILDHLPEKLSQLPFYKLHPSPLRLKKLDQRICISDDPKFVYFRIPKAANTNVVASIYYAIHGHLNVGIAEVNAYKNAFRRPSTLSEDEAVLLTETHATFTVVRNPFTRLLSGYLQKLVYGTSMRLPMLAKMGKRSDETISIDEFLEYLDSGGINADPHWCRQVDLIPIGVEKVQFVGRVESIEEDVGRILSAVFDRPCAFQNFNARGTNAKDRIQEFLTPERQVKVGRLYAEDFDRLAYPTRIAGG